MPNHNRLLSNSLEIAVAFLLYLIALVASNLIASLLDGDFSLLLYLPAGIKLLSILVFQWRGAIGIGLAILARFLFYDQAYTVMQSIAMASINAGVTYLVISSYLKVFKISENLENLNVWHIIGLSAVCSITNGFLFSWLLFYFKHLEFEQYLRKVFFVVINNFTGNALIAWFLMYLSRRQFLQKHLHNLQRP